MEDPQTTNLSAADELAALIIEALCDDLETWQADRQPCGLVAWMSPRLDARRAELVAEHGEAGAAAFESAMLAARWVTSRYA